MLFKVFSDKYTHLTSKKCWQEASCIYRAQVKSLPLQIPSCEQLRLLLFYLSTLIHLFVCLETMSLCISWLPWNLPSRPDWSQTQERATCLCLLSANIKGRHHHFIIPGSCDFMTCLEVIYQKFTVTSFLICVSLPYSLHCLSDGDSSACCKLCC